MIITSGGEAREVPSPVSSLAAMSPAERVCVVQDYFALGYITRAQAVALLFGEKPPPTPWHMRARWWLGWLWAGFRRGWNTGRV